MKKLALLCLATLNPTVAVSEGTLREAGLEPVRPSASVALLVALDSVFEVAPESSLDLLSADSHVVEATEAKASHLVVELDLIVRADRGSTAETDFGGLQKALAKRVVEPSGEQASYELFKRTLLRIGEEGGALAGRAGVPDVIPGGTHRGTLRAEFPIAAIPTYSLQGLKDEGRSSLQGSGGKLAQYIRQIAQDRRVQFGGVKIRPRSTPVIGGERRDVGVAPMDRAKAGQGETPIDFKKISNLLFLLETQSAGAVVTSIELGPVVKGLTKSFEFQLSVYE
jgi:hypothetical protein